MLLKMGPKKDFNCAKSTSTPIITYNQTLGNKNDVWHYNNGICKYKVPNG